MKLNVATLALASVLSFGAQATTIDWGVHDPLEVAAAITPIGLFTDTYLFELAAASSLFSTAVANNLTDVLGIAGGTVALFKEAGAVDTAMGGFGFGGVTGNISHTFGALVERLLQSCPLRGCSSVDRASPS